jgi:predicted restriction endonuclease
LTAEAEKKLKPIPETEREELIKSRLGQGRFRRDLLKVRDRCYVTGLASVGFLRASHIKPWSESTNAERLDPHNGLLLSPNIDMLFDRALISFENDGRILIAADIPRNVVGAFGLEQSFRGEPFHANATKYLSFHRELHRRKLREAKLKRAANNAED